MAKKETISIYVNGKQAEDVIKGLEAQSKSLGVELGKLREKIKDVPEDTKEWKKLNKEIEELEVRQRNLDKTIVSGWKTIKSYNDVMSDLSSARLNELTRAQKHLRSMLRGMSKEDTGYEETVEKLRMVDDAILRIKDSWKGTSQAAREAQEIEMTSQLSKLPKLSDKDIADQKKYWQELADGAERGSLAWEEYASKVQMVSNEEQRRQSIQAKTVIEDVSKSSFTGSVSETQEAIKLLQQYRLTLDTTDAKGLQEVDAALLVLNQHVKEASKEYITFSQTLEDVSSLSDQDLASQKKYWQEMANGAEKGSDKLSEYQSKLQQVIDEEQRRISIQEKDTKRYQEYQAKSLISGVGEGTFTGSIGETQEAIKLLQQYRLTLETTDAKGLQEVDNALAELNERVKQSSSDFISLNEAIRQSRTVGEGTFDGSIADLERLKKTLEEYKREVAVSNPEGLKDIEDSINKVEKKLSEAKYASIDLDDVLKNLDKKSFEELSLAADKLQAEVKQAGQDTEEFARKSAELRQVNAQLDEVKDNWKETSEETNNAAKSVLAYIAAYLGLDQLLDKLQQIFSANLELSDSLAAVQKTTGLTAKEVGSLSSEIDKIDTRASQEQLHQLAATAGQMGVTAQEDILGFVRAANQLTVALDELGEDGVEALVKINQLTGETDKLGLERALLASGSAINELSASSAASAGPIADVISRLGGIGSAANLATADLAALGATADALGQSSEVAGSSLAKFIGTLVSKSDQVADAVGLDRQYLQGLIDQGNTMEAMIAVFEKMEGMGGYTKLAPILGDLGSEGARASALFAAFAGNVNLLKSQVDVSRTAFAEATSVTREYNTVNETAAALVQRMGNSIREFFVNSGVVEWITNLLRAVMDLPGWLDRNVFAINGVTASVTSLGAAIAVCNVKMMLATKGVTTWAGAWKLLTAAANTSKTAILGVLQIITKHPIMLAATAATAALGYLVGAIVKASKSTKELSEQQKTLNESTKSYDAQVLKEQRSLNDLYGALNRAKQGTEARRKLIGQINTQYGKYLDNMLTEKSTADEIRKSYDKINESLRENIALKAQKETIDKIQAQGVEEQATQLQNLRDSFGEYTDNSGLIETVIGQVVQRVDSAQQQGISNIKVLYDVQRELLGSIVGGGQEVSEEMANALDAYIRSVYGTAVAIQNTKKKYAPIIGSNPSGAGTVTTTEESDGTGEATGTPISEQEKKRIAKENERAAVQGYKDSLKLIDAYYKDREALVRKRIMEEGKSEADLNIELNRLNDERLRDTEQFQKRMLGMKNTFDPSKFKVTVDGKEEVYFSEKDMKKLETNVKTYGSKMTAGIRQELTNTQVEIQSKTWGIKQEMMKVLLDNDDIARVTNDFQEALTTTGLFSSDIENLDKQQADKRLSLLKEWSKDSQNMTLQDIKNKVMLEESFDEWREKRTDEHYQALLMMLRNFGIEVADIERQQQEDRQKLVEDKWLQSGKSEKWEKKDTENQRSLDLTSRAMDMGLASQEQVDDAEIKLYQDRLLAAREYYNFVLEHGGNLLEAERERNEAYLALDQAELQSQQHKMETMQGYADALTGFAEQMGEAAWGEVDDRKEAAKQLLKTTMELTKQLILEKVKELITKQTLSQQEITMEQTTEQAKTAIQGQSAITDLTVEQAKTQAQNTMGISQASSKTLGKLGWWGIPLIAVITAALNALMSAAMGSVNKAKAEVSSATGVSGGRLATGMLTYAEGNYPVLGNDGNVYNAKYEGKEIKTGIYRGGAHFGIFSEKKPEAIIDGDTTQRLILNHPDIWRAIVTLSKNGRIDRGMRTFATGNINELAKQAQVAEQQAAVVDMAVLNDTITSLREMMAVNNGIMSSIATNGIQAHLEMYGQNGAFKQMKKAEKFANRVGYK